MGCLVTNHGRSFKSIFGHGSAYPFAGHLANLTTSGLHRRMTTPMAGRKEKEGSIRYRPSLSSQTMYSMFNIFVNCYFSIVMYDIHVHFKCIARTTLRRDYQIKDYMLMLPMV
jgi:hypothetical protein